MKTWSAYQLNDGIWLRSPTGVAVAKFKKLAEAKQCAAAMNLTTQKQRINYLAEEAGYRGTI